MLGRLNKIINLLTSPITLAGVYMIINFYSSSFHTSALEIGYIITLLIFWVGLSVYFFENKFSKGNPIVLSYFTWLIAAVTVTLSLKKFVFDYHFIFSVLILLIMSGYIFYVIIKQKADARLIALGSFSAYSLMVSLNIQWLYYVLLITLIITGIYASLKYKSKAHQLIPLLSNYLIGVLCFYLAFFITKSLFKLITYF